MGRPRPRPEPTAEHAAQIKLRRLKRQHRDGNPLIADICDQLIHQLYELPRRIAECATVAAEYLRRSIALGMERLRELIAV